MKNSKNVNVGNEDVVSLRLRECTVNASIVKSSCHKKKNIERRVSEWESPYAASTAASNCYQSRLQKYPFQFNSSAGTSSAAARTLDAACEASRTGEISESIIDAEETSSSITAMSAD